MITRRYRVVYSRNPLIFIGPAVRLGSRKSDRGRLRIARKRFTFDGVVVVFDSNSVYIFFSKIYHAIESNREPLFEVFWADGERTRFRVDDNGFPG